MEKQQPFSGPSLSQNKIFPCECDRGKSLSGILLSLGEKRKGGDLDRTVCLSPPPQTIRRQMVQLLELLQGTDESLFPLLFLIKIFIEFIGVTLVNKIM